MNQYNKTPVLHSAEVSSAESWSLTLAALDHLDQALSVYDRHLRLVGWNRRFFELLEFPFELARIGTPFSEFIRYNALRGEYGPGEPEALVAERVELALRFEPHCFERTRPDGTVLEIRGNPIADGGFVTIYTDITERKRAEAMLQESHDQLETRVAVRTAKLQALNDRLAMEVSTREHVAAALRERERWLRLVTDAIPALIAYIDANGRYVFANKKYEDWFGIPVQKIIGRPWGALIDPVRTERLHASMEAVLNGNKVSLECELKNGAGETLCLRCALVPHVGEDGRIVGFFYLGQDFTEYKKTQAVLNQALKMEAIGQLTGGIAHDFSNLLTIIMGNLAVLEDADSLHSQAALDTAMRAAYRGAELTRRLLAFSRRQPLTPRVLEAPRLMAALSAFLERTLSKSIVLETQIDESVWNVLADPNQLSNALLNLALNARDAMPDGGKLSITATNAVLDQNLVADNPDAKPGEYVVLSVADTGVGMPPEVMEHACEPFFTTKKNCDGTGLGLSMVYGFVRQSGGHLEITSQVGEGAQVRLYLPRAQTVNSDAPLHQSLQTELQ